VVMQLLGMRSPADFVLDTESCGFAVHLLHKRWMAEVCSNILGSCETSSAIGQTTTEQGFHLQSATGREKFSSYLTHYSQEPTKLLTKSQAEMN
jgi:hypothetical protein